MKSTGIVRKVDELGRIVLPIEMRRTLDIGEKDALEIYVEGSSVILKKYKPSCVFCDATKDITVFKGKNICPKCLKELKEPIPPGRHLSAGFPGPPAAGLALSPPPA